VEDVEIARTRGRSLGVAEGADLKTFEDGHADYVRITSELLDESDAYWSRAGSKCAGATQPGEGFLRCRTNLGTRDAMRPEREFTVTESYINKLVLKPRLRDDPTLSDLVACCFPQSVSYEVRGAKAWVVRGSSSGYRHDLTSDRESGRCELDTDPLHSQRRGRVYEVSCDPESTDCVNRAEDGTVTPKSIGLGEKGEACVVQSPTEITKVDDSPCVYRGLTSRFVVYRGQRESFRDWKFTWEVGGGFTPMAFNLAVSSDPFSIPQTMVFSKQLGDLVIADGASKGLVTIDLGTFQTHFFF
jgi:hypothetical protein